MINPENIFSSSIKDIPESFIREILKVADGKSMISFAGGLPNPIYFPVQQIADAAQKVLTKDGKIILQYSTTEGYTPLRSYLAEMHQKKTGIETSIEQIIILNGAQQGIDLTGKIFLNKEDRALIEAPSYLGAIQSLSIYTKNLFGISMENDGICIQELEKKINGGAKILYTVPSYQNPTGLSYSLAKRESVAKIINASDTILMEDNPYGEIYFTEEPNQLIQPMAESNTVYLGSFSKSVSPGLRLGWAVAPKKIIQKLSICKQATDLHTSIFTQKVLYQYLLDNNIDDHLAGIRSFYKKQRDEMLILIKKHFPEGSFYTAPDGGMFLWVTLPDFIDIDDLLNKAMTQNVIFVPGKSFFFNGEKKSNSIRLNFSNPCKEYMERGIKIIGSLIAEQVTQIQ